MKGIRSVMDKMLEELTPNGTYYDFGAPGLFPEIMGPYFDLWQKRKRKGKVMSYVIFNEDVKKKYPNLLKSYYGKGKFYAKEYSSTTDTMIYNDTVVLFIWTAKPPIAIVIKNKENAKGYKNQFMLMWNVAKT